MKWWVVPMWSGITGAELLDAALIDGAGESGVCSRVILPLSKPAFAAVPMIIVFFAFQKHFLKGLTIGALKG